MVRYQIIIGEIEAPLFSFRNHQIKSCNIESAVDLIGNELTVDTTEFEVSCDDDSLRLLPYATPALIYNQDRLLGKFYTTETERTKINVYKITAVSAIGILSHETFYGGMYNAKSFDRVVRQIIGSNGLQLYAGYYRKCRTTGSYCMAHNLGNEPYSSANNYYSVLSATMQSRLKANFKIIELDAVYLPALVRMLGGYKMDVLGCSTADGETDTVVLSHRYGMYLNVVRNTSDTSKAAYGQMVFEYGNQSYNLGIPTDGTTYDVDINPSEGKATINGVDYSITKSSSDYRIPIHAYAGGTQALSYDSTKKYVRGTPTVQFIKAEYGEYKIYDENGNLQCDAVLVKNEYEDEFCAYDLVNELEENRKSSLTRTLEPNEDITIADSDEHPAFHLQTALENEILQSVLFADNVGSLKIYGWIPICSKRDAIQALLISQGVIIRKTENGELFFTSPTTDEEGNINDGRIYDGGSVTYPEIVNIIEVTEHGYGNDTTKAVEEVYANTTGASKPYIAEFKTLPIVENTLVADNLVVCCHNCNAAVVKGTGKLNGRAYEHSESKIKRILNNLPSGKSISVSDATLVTMQNSEVLLDRLEAYYGSATKIKMAFVAHAEKCGAMYHCKNPYSEEKSAFLVRKTEQVSGIIKADSELITDYDPPEIGEGYQYYTILSGSGTWETPASVYAKDNPRIRVILIGGGSGGAGGFAGEDGAVPSGETSVQAASGGSAGEGGAGGNIFNLTIDNPATEFSYACGVGGAGGGISTSTEENNPGVDGTDTTLSDGINSYSSASGERLEKGITNFFTGDIYGKKNTAELNGAGKGGDGGYFIVQDKKGYYMQPRWGIGIANTVSNCGGNPGTHYPNNGSPVLLCAGAGGGGASGQQGGDGTNATSSRSGSGGNGGNAVETPMKATVYNSKYYGHGGFGGCGGGGGGAAGFYVTGSAGAGGQGGYGGHGGDGGDGCVLIYY